MKLSINRNTYELYLKHIVGEVFPQGFICEHTDEDLIVSISESSENIRVSASLLGFTTDQTEVISNHSSASIATTCAIGKCIILLGNKFGFNSTPYGALTGVRPLKVAKSLYTHDKDIGEQLNDLYWVDKSKGKLLSSCLSYDRTVQNQHKATDVSLYVSIPFCPSRCNYCSFVSSSIEHKQGLIPEYIKILVKEINLVSRVLIEKGSTVKSIYVGGGTPGILPPTELKLLLNEINNSFMSDTVKEFSFELGRPDTVTDEKLGLLKEFNVNRVCINTQTTNNNVLSSIGRRHTAEQYFESVALAQKYEFDAINTDLIAGLEGESLESFQKSLREVIDTGVENVSVHTLCVKKSSHIREKFGTDLTVDNINEFIDFSQDHCIYSGFEPYYLYRQKYSLGNHENVGWCKNNKYSHYNISMMNEIESVIGMGAGATTRIISEIENEKHMHFENFKYPFDYIRDEDKMLALVDNIKSNLNY